MHHFVATTEIGSDNLLMKESGKGGRKERVVLREPISYALIRSGIGEVLN
jgi:hypothetical protein